MKSITEVIIESFSKENLNKLQNVTESTNTLATFKTESAIQSVNFELMHELSAKFVSAWYKNKFGSVVMERIELTDKENLFYYFGANASDWVKIDSIKAGKMLQKWKNAMKSKGYGVILFEKE